MELFSPFYMNKTFYPSSKILENFKIAQFENLVISLLSVFFKNAQEISPSKAAPVQSDLSS